MKRALVAVAASVLGAGLAFSLSGCNRNYEILGPYSLGYDGEHLLIGVCTGLQIDRVSLLETHGARMQDDTRVVWEAHGDLYARMGDTLVVAGPNPGLRNDVAARDARPTPGALLELGFNDATEAELSASFTIPDDGFAPGVWLTPTGEIRDGACASPNSRR